MILTKDNIKLGLVLGLIGPILGLVIVYKANYSYISFGDFIDYAVHDNAVITKLGTFSLLANAFLFAIYVHFNKVQTFKGIFFMTMLYGIAILVLKLFN